MNSLEVAERDAAAVAVARRVSLADIEAAIGGVYYITGYEALRPFTAISEEHADHLHVLTICLVVMRNGFVFVGKSAPAEPANYNEELGTKFAYEDAIRQIWPYMGFALREKIANGA